MPDDVQIKLTNVSKTYNETKNRRKDALKNISLDLIGPGMVFVVGESGSGKTTLLNLIGALDTTSGGVITVNGRILDHMTRRARHHFRISDTGFGFQDCRLFSEMSVLANVTLALGFHIRGRKRQSELAITALKEMELDEFAHKDIEELSKGQKRRLALSRVLALNRPVYLMDDPTFRLNHSETKLVMEALCRRAVASLVIIATPDAELAEAYGNRVIRLENGSVISDTRIIPQKSLEVSSDLVAVPTKNPTGFLHVVDFFRLTFGNLGRMLWFALSMLFIMTISMTVIESTGAVSDYDSYSAYQRLIERNEEYLIQITQYLDQQYHTRNGVFSYRGPDPDENFPNDLKKLSEKINYRVPVYASYYFNWNFQDFLPIKQTYSSASVEADDAAMHFTELVIVDDFIQFNQPFQYGNKPTHPDDVLIFDYMAKRLVDTAMVPEVETMADLVGVTLTDRDTGLTMTISGILKSRYTQHLSVPETDEERFRFASEYLSQRQAIIATPAFLEEVEDRKNDFSILELTGSYDGVAFSNTDYRKLEYLPDLDDLTIIGDAPTNVNRDYLLLSDRQLAELLNVPLASITDTFVNELDMTVFDYELSSYRYDKSITRSLAIQRSDFPILIYQAAELDSHTLKFLRDPDEPTFFASGEFRGMYLSLAASKTVNKKVMAVFQWPKASDPFYDQFSNYIRAGFAEYTPYRQTILDINTKQDALVTIGNWCAALALFLTLVGVTAGSIGSVRQNRHHIKVLKALGIANVSLILILFVDLLVVLGVAFALAYFLASLPIDQLNEQFLAIYGFELVSIQSEAAHYLPALVATAIVGLFFPTLAISLAMAKVPLRTVSKIKV